MFLYFTCFKLLSILLIRYHFLLVSLIYVFFSVNDWLKAADTTVGGKTDGINKLWLHLACPTRIAQHKDGICEASSFDNLNDDLYMKSVKPAHSSFGVVSYDQKSDSTLLVRSNYPISIVNFRTTLSFGNWNTICY